MKCPVCGSAELVREARDEVYSYKGHTLLIRDVVADYCPACGEAILDMAEAQRLSETELAFDQQVNAGLADPSLFLRVRKKLGLNQREAGEIFGGGVNAFSRYESGRTTPPVALIKLLKLLDRHPDLLAEIR